MTPEQKLEMLEKYLEATIKSHNKFAESLAESKRYAMAESFKNEAFALDSILRMLQDDEFFNKMYAIEVKGE